MKTIPLSEHRPVVQALAKAKRTATAAHRKLKTLETKLTQLEGLIAQAKNHPSRELTPKQIQTAEAALVAMHTAHVELDTLLLAAIAAAPQESPAPAGAAS